MLEHTSHNGKWRVELYDGTPGWTSIAIRVGKTRREDKTVMVSVAQPTVAASLALLAQRLHDCKQHAAQLVVVEFKKKLGEITDVDATPKPS